jgi:hypothetical protein
MGVAMFEWITQNATALGVIIALLAASFPSIQYVLTKKSEDRKHTFETYHRLIDDLVGASGKPKLDRQIAIIFELKNFKAYYPVSLRILEGLKTTWSNPDIEPRLVNELNLTIAYLRKNALMRFIDRIRL